jgi:hypothetical protein
MSAWYDGRRGIVLASLATVWTGVVVHHLLNALERWQPQRLGWPAVWRKLLLTQLFFNPCLYLPVFFAWTGLGRRHGLEQSIEHARREYWPTLKATWCIFTPVNVISFGFVPVRHQAPLNAAVGVVYNVMLSVVAGRDVA